MPAKVNFVGYRPVVKTLYFNDLVMNDGFKIRNGEAVYVKTVSPSGKDYMLEIATGRLWHPTRSEVVKVDIEINVNVPRPSIY